MAPPVWCYSCGKGLDRVLRCSRCSVAAYCDRECQELHWTGDHKRSCGYVGAKTFSELCGMLGGEASAFSLMEEAACRGTDDMPLPPPLTADIVDRFVDFAEGIPPRNEVQRHYTLALCARASLLVARGACYPVEQKRHYATRLMARRAGMSDEHAYGPFDGVISLFIASNSSATSTKGCVEELLALARSAYPKILRYAARWKAVALSMRRVASAILYSPIGRGSFDDSPLRHSLLREAERFMIVAVKEQMRRTDNRRELAETRIVLGHALLLQYRSLECINAFRHAFDSLHDHEASDHANSLCMYAAALTALRRLNDATAIRRKALQWYARPPFTEAVYTITIQIFTLLYEAAYGMRRYQEAVQLAREAEPVAKAFQQRFLQEDTKARTLKFRLCEIEAQVAREVAPLELLMSLLRKRAAEEALEEVRRMEHELAEAEAEQRALWDEACAAARAQLLSHSGESGDAFENGGSAAAAAGGGGGGEPLLLQKDGGGLGGDAKAKKKKRKSARKKKAPSRAKAVNEKDIARAVLRAVAVVLNMCRPSRTWRRMQGRVVIIRRRRRRRMGTCARCV